MLEEASDLLVRSPRVWGWTVAYGTVVGVDAEIPTRVGMDR